MPRLAKSKSKGAGKHKGVPYATGFRPPSQKQASIACGNVHQRTELEPYKSFKPIPKCNSENDWLAQYCEEGQNFSEFKQMCPWLSKRKCTRLKQDFVPSGKTLQDRYPDGAICLLPLGDFDSQSSPDFKSLVEYASIFFNVSVKILPKIKLENDGKNGIYCTYQNPKKKYYIESRRKDEKYQLNIVSLIRFVGSIAPDEALCTIALTMSDLYEAKADLFVAGMAAGNHRVGVFSFYRYDPNVQFSPEFWYETTYTEIKCSDDEKKRLLLARSCRLLVHEIAHVLGVGHCIYYECCMNGSGHLEEDFRQPMFLCPVDLHKLETLCGFDILQRYQKLRNFFEKFGLASEQIWIEKRLEYIKNAPK